MLGGIKLGGLMLGRWARGKNHVGGGVFEEVLGNVELSFGELEGLRQIGGGHIRGGCSF